MNFIRKHLYPLIGSFTFVLLIVFISNEYIYKKIDQDYAFGIDQLKILENAGLNKNLFNVKNIWGDQINLEEFNNKIIIITFWASWCSPCVEEFPSFLELVKKNNDILIVAISLDESLSEALNFLKSMKLGNLEQGFIFIHDNEKSISKHFGVLRLPESFIFSKDNKFQKKIIGINDWMSAGTLKYLNSIR